jgi:MFS family permease
MQNSPVRVIIVLLSIAVGATIGGKLSDKLGFALATLGGRDIAQIETAFLWCIITAPIVFATAAAWIALAALRSPWRRVGLWTFVIASAVSALVIYVSYAPIKTSGTPMSAAIRSDTARAFSCERRKRAGRLGPARQAYISG